MLIRLATLAKELSQKHILILLFCLSTLPLLSQNKNGHLASVSFDGQPRGDSRVRLVFYNVENLFDYFNDSTTIDEEFTPIEGKFWSKSRYLDKLNKIAKTLLAIGGWEPPAMIGLCEIENRYVLEGLTKFTQLKSIGYEIVHQDSKDPRGIDVAVLYRPDKIKLLNYESYQINFPFDSKSRTRDILHVVGQLPNRDTLHFLVNHWPSKFGGAFETEPKRLFVAQFVRAKIDSLLALNPHSSIVITGDFNDEPQEESLIEGLNTNNDRSALQSYDLFNLMYELRYITGTHSFQNKWSILDQFIVSGNLLMRDSPTKVYQDIAHIFDVEWLLMVGATGATRPFRTYQGPKYIGGYSDHLPIYLDLLLK